MMYTLNTVKFDFPFPLLAIFSQLTVYNTHGSKSSLFRWYGLGAELIINYAHHISGNENDKHIKKLITPCYMSEIQ